MAKKPEILTDYLRLNEGTEIPGEFAIWCGLSGLSAVLGRKVWIDMGVYRVYPNLYAVLVAGSGRCRKSTAIGVIERLLHSLDPPLNLVAQRLTPEALIDALRRIDATEGKQSPRGTCEGMVIVDELANFLNKNTYEGGLAALLIPMYDCKDKFEYRTKGRGSEVLFNTCLGLLGASTIDWIKNAIPEDAIGGGLTSRIVFIYVEKPPPPVAITRFSEEQYEAQLRVQRSLQKLREIKGEIKLSQSALSRFEEVYNTFYRESEFYEMTALAGYASRRHVHLLKIAMILALAERAEKVIEPRHLRYAEELLVLTERSMPKVISLITASEKGTTQQGVLKALEKTGKISKVELYRKLSNKFDRFEIEKILDTLVQAQRIRVVSDGRNVYYERI